MWETVTPEPITNSPGTPVRTLEVHALQCIRGDRVLFSGLNFSIESGEVLQIEGHNGCGKTTLLRVLSGLTLPSEGEVYWCGSNIRDSYAEFLADAAYVGHSNGIKDELTPVENLNIAQALGRPRHEADPAVALEKLGLIDIEARPCRTLSAGQQRRVALARLLLTDAPLWILDEPFTALDKKGRRLIEELLIDHANRGGMVAVTTHHILELHFSQVRPLYLGD
jgi:heme exporter protein A